MIVYTEICDRMSLTRKPAINIQIFAVSEVSGGSYGNRNGNRGNGNLRPLQTVKNSVPFLFAAHDK